MNSVADTPWTFPKRLLPFLSTDYRSQTSKNELNFFLFLEKYFRHEKGTVAKPFLGLAEKDDSEYLKDSRYETTEF